MQLAQLDRDEALAKGYWNLSMILLILLLAVVLLTTMFLLRRWKRRQLKAIEKDKATRRAGRSAGRVDAWQASSERYVDHDKLSEQDEPFERKEPPPEDGAEREPGEGDPNEPDDEDHDPYGLFRDKPYKDSDDEDDFEDEDDWDEEEDKP